MSASSSSSTPNLDALLTPPITKSLLSLDRVTPLFLITCSAGKIFHLGPSQQQQANNNNNNEQQPQTSSSSSSSSTPNTWIFTQVPTIREIENPNHRVKAATFLAEAIKKCAAADHGGSSKDGSIGRENKEKFEKGLDLIVPKVEFVAEEDRELAIPDDDDGNKNKNSKHRAGRQLWKEKKLERVEKQMTSMLARCATDEDKERVMKTREFQWLVADREQLMKSGELKVKERTEQQQQKQQNQNQNQNQQPKTMLNAGTRRDRDGNAAVGAMDDDYDDL